VAHEGQPAWVSNALDHSGAVRGTITDPPVTLPAGYEGRVVVGPDGQLAGYMVGDLGFVELAVARDGGALQALDGCMTTYATRHTASADCESRLAADHVQVIRAG
jgi:hypothetical protein